MECKPSTADFEDFRKQGRAILVACTSPAGVPVYICSAYGFAGSHEKPMQRAQTEALVRAILCELQTLGEAVVFLAMDLNCDPSDILVLDQVIAA
eukprot:1250530-Alexandrium_andersonii.AAC.1